MDDWLSSELLDTDCCPSACCRIEGQGVSLEAKVKLHTYFR